ncbi:MAG: class I SAM-dependent methyltransferase [Bacteroidales bacterium]|nr:class I SAM-dependent methyltransferase [Bacteroidales bacterium]
MSKFDARARDWDKNQRYIDRSNAVAKAMLQTVPFKKSMKALEYGSGTALLSFALKDKFEEIVLMDNSQEMTTVTAEKIADQNIENMKPLFFDLEHQDYDGKFDIIYNQMVMHHVNDVDSVLSKFYTMLNPGGYLTIADLYAEDGSFHGESFNGHLGFDVDLLADKLKAIGYRDIEQQKCYTIAKTDETGNVSEYPIFLLIASKPK